MRLLADENFPLDAVEALRADGHDVAWIREDSRGTSDNVILIRAQEENRIVVTFDKDFGELAFRSKLPAQSGVILFRVTPKSSQYIAQAAFQALASRDNWAGHVSVVEDNRDIFDTGISRHTTKGKADMNVAKELLVKALEARRK